MKYTTILNGETYEVDIQADGSVVVNGTRYEVDFLDLGNSLYSIIRDTRSQELAIEEDQGNYEVLVGGRMYETQVLDQRAMLMASRKGGLSVGSGEIHAPMPGLIVEVPVETGEAVAKGDTVVVLELMKMQNELKSPIDGTIQSINCKTGQTVDKNALLIVVKPDEE